MIQFPFKLETTKSNLTARSGLALMAEFNHGIGLRELTDRYLPKPGSNRGFKPSVFVETMVLMLQGGGRSLEDIRELKNEEGLMRHTIETFRWKIIQVAGRIVRHSKSVILKIAGDIEKLELFKGIREKIFELSLVYDNPFNGE